MNKWIKQAIVWKPEGDGAGSGSGDSSGGQGGVAASGDGAAPADAGAPAGAAAADPSPTRVDILGSTPDPKPDGKADPVTDPKPGEWKAPDGLPDHLKGKDPDETLSKVLKAYNGARKELSTKGSGALEGKVPETPDGYVFEAMGENDPIAAELNSAETKPILDAFRASALKHGIPDKAFVAFMRDGMDGVAKAGFALGQTTDEAIQISAAAEMEKLTSQVGAKEASTIVATTTAYGQKLVDRGLMTPADLAEFKVMIGTADSARIFHRILTTELGEAPIPMGDPARGEVSPLDAQAAYTAALRLPAGAERDAALQRAQGQMAKAYGSESASSVRTSFL
jgi:hypothetical protein